MKLFIPRIALAGSMVWLMSIATTASAQTEFPDRFVGNWIANKDKTINYYNEHPEMEGPPDEMLEDFPNFHLTILVDGKAKVRAEMEGEEVQNLEGTWKLLEQVDENSARVEIMMVVDDRNDDQVFEVEFLTDTTVVLSIEDDDMVIVFDRDDEKTEPAEPSGDR